ncbi:MULTISPECIES: mechanosensitive ion channel family protein [Rhodobacterales]|jgi:small-conductance mechanosensitive channel|uniref:mechanosensitive ion channel family protein n=1 Tax=Rhodobacterales TaxID=204455 RepID=UPI00237FD5A7|nr:mechanosensitive ion channel domain-containing protein [Phaeobacter gallaeciensis]MDE4141903.1 mechanosensitive ion channel [Phaeobacter gallaeciensis]MDE4150149.1 mechanosensitive ion channel [Phaeobacter gallaeciensis]MDE4154574.1 mechanosensitive ion channel [Phaeobacter gallaeciensis]MDE4229766.1 mechanosensitive ion channel [Phaeobacter gallaeciensis]MDE4259040.1 mechanosensitive ion channel [Phaeobacter gallaeciensis]
MKQEQLPETLIEFLVSLWNKVWMLSEQFLTPGWRQYQMLIVGGLVILAYLLRLLTKTQWDNWGHRRTGWPKWRLRALIHMIRRLTLIYFIVLSWAAYLLMQNVTWPSRSYLIGIAATLATAWLVIGIIARLVRNHTLRRLFTWSLWIYATLVALNLVDDVAEFLDSVAITFGAMHLSMLAVLKALMLAAVLLTLARFGSNAAGKGLKGNSDISPSMQVLIGKAIQLALYGLAIIISIRAIGFDLTGLAVLSGAVGVGIGFGLQKVVSNLVSGIIILMDRSIKPGDVISLGETFGWINALGARYVSVVTRDGREYLIPNEDLITSQVVNWSHSDRYVRLDINFGTGYGDDPHQVRRVAIAAARSVNRVLSTPGKAPVCHIIGFGDSSVDYVLRFWISDPTAGLTNIRGNVFLALWDAFQAEGISIPFPQREVRVLNTPLEISEPVEEPAPEAPKG